MDLPKILEQLRRERELLEEVIASLQKLAAASGSRRRGRPPAWLNARKPEERPRVKTTGSANE